MFGGFKDIAFNVLLCKMWNIGRWVPNVWQSGMHLIKGSQVLINTAMLSVQRSLPSTCYRISYYYRGGTCSQTVFCLFCMRLHRRVTVNWLTLWQTVLLRWRKHFPFLFLRQSTHPRLPSWNFHCDERWHCTIWTLDKWLCPAYLWCPGYSEKPFYLEDRLTACALLQLVDNISCLDLFQ